MSTDLLQQTCDRYEIADAIHRYAFGLDHGDADSLASALTEDCTLDFQPAGRNSGSSSPVKWSPGHPGCSAALLGHSTLLTPRAIFRSKSAATRPPLCLCDVATFHAAEAARRGSENALLMNRYDCELRRPKWRFKRVTIECVDARRPEILNVRATHRVLGAKSKRNS